MAIINANVNPEYKVYMHTYQALWENGVQVAGSPKQVHDQEPPGSTLGDDFGVYLADASPPAMSHQLGHAKAQAAGYVNLQPSATNPFCEAKVKFNVDCAAQGNVPQDPHIRANAWAMGYAACSQRAEWLGGARQVSGAFRFNWDGILGNGIYAGPFKQYAKLGNSWITATYHHDNVGGNPDEPYWSYVGQLQVEGGPAVQVNETFSGQQQPLNGKRFLFSENIVDGVGFLCYVNNNPFGFNWLTARLTGTAENGNVTHQWPNSGGEVQGGVICSIEGLN